MNRILKIYPLTASSKVIFHIRKNIIERLIIYLDTISKAKMLENNSHPFMIYLTFLVFMTGKKEKEVTPIGLEVQVMAEQSYFVFLSSLKETILFPIKLLLIHRYFYCQKYLNFDNI